MKAKSIGEPENVIVADQDKYFIIVSKLGGKALTAETDGDIVMRPLNGEKSQVWKFVYVNGTCYRLLSTATGKALDVVALGTENGTWVHQWAPVDSDSQVWSLEQSGDGYQIKSKLSGKALDVVAMSQEDGAHVQIWEDVSGDNQLWKLEAVVKEETTAPKKTARKPAAKKPAAKSTAAAKSAAKKTDSAKKETVTKPKTTRKPRTAAKTAADETK